MKEPVGTGDVDVVDGIERGALIVNDVELIKVPNVGVGIGCVGLKYLVVGYSGTVGLHVMYNGDPDVGNGTDGVSSLKSVTQLNTFNCDLLANPGVSCVSSLWNQDDGVNISSNVASVDLPKKSYVVYLCHGKRK